MQWNDIFQQIAVAINQPFNPTSLSAINGGDINQAYLLKSNGLKVFVKLNQVSRLSMFEAELQALLEMQASDTLRIPKPLCCGTSGTNAFIAMEYISFGSANSTSQRLLGEQLAAMHRITAKHFGWQRNNTIGSTIQLNEQSDDWVSFWCDQRIDLQLKLLNQGGHQGAIQSLGQQLLDALPTLLAGHNPSPSMLHGDLWSGNVAFDVQGQPVIYDPAFYYGDRETDIAMTELFGGFSAEFYAAYQATYPLDNGYEQRNKIYNLYHILNHSNLFGGHYVTQAVGMMRQLLL